MARILACVDGSAYAESVADCAAYAAKGLSADVELLHVLGRRDAPSRDFSGRVGFEGRSQLLERLSALDEERFRLLQQSGRLALDALRERLAAAGAPNVHATLRTGDLLEEIAARESEADLLVIGKRGEASDYARLHLGSNLERVIRASTLPVLVAAKSFRPVERAVIAFDGRSGALKALDAVSRSPLARGVAFTVVTAGERTGEARRMLESALSLLRAGGLEAEGRIVPGEPATVIGAAVEETGAGLLVMGAYGHSRLRSLVVGSVTAELINGCRVPALVHR
ncbi:MAG: universal stress protein [Pikeienuella sp.]|uniref:universal stress protein n=1 Tax=Pikeienuella sp. TaxID=2831957 RepID=UPI00391B06DA